ncbi:hypothetical protein E2C01_047760 [Portunus trituberculatus]|uniref:Uncharacterized protein n=1 Tax=Portunus trituberculatus TaxID=210409 RepID=A0A5B7G8L9_PORTR|nr:hypothetical protein [Portunus trituberculatus]
MNKSQQISPSDTDGPTMSFHHHCMAYQAVHTEMDSLTTTIPRYKQGDQELSCSSRPNCKGFNSNGQLRRRLIERGRDT